MSQNILSYLKSKFVIIIGFSLILSAVFYAASFMFSNLYKTDVYCYSNIFDNVHNKSVFNSFNLLIGTGNNAEIKHLTNLDDEVINQIKQVDFFEIISNEKQRIIDRSGCNYLEDLITCVHIIQLKVLTCVRVGNKQKKIDISIPKLDDFIHKVYIHCARKIYSNVYLFEKNLNPLQIQKSNRELELIVQECLMISIRDSIPTEDIIRAYMDESVEEEEQVIIEDIPRKDERQEHMIEKNQDESVVVPPSESFTPQNMSVDSNENNEEPNIELGITDLDDEKVITKLSFNDMDSILDVDNNVSTIEAPKSIERLEEISTSRALERLMEQD
jgi:hypothetical protein